MANSYPTIPPPESGTEMSLREFGRRLNCTERAVRQAFEAGKIKTGIYQMPEMKRPKVVYEVAKKEWEENGGLVYKYNRITHIPGQAEPNRENASNTPKPPTTPPDATVMSLAESSRQTSIAQMKLKQMEVGEKAGQLVRRDRVNSQLYNIGQELRNSLMQLPDRVIDAVMACKTRNEGLLILQSAIGGELERISDLHKRDFTER